MKKNLLNVIFPLLVLLSLISVLCACGNKDEIKDEKENENTLSLQIDTLPVQNGAKGFLQTNDADLSSAYGRYGTAKTVDDITEYVDHDGVTTVPVNPEKPTVLKTEYISAIDSNGQPQFASIYIGFDSHSVNLREGCVLRVQIISPAQQVEYQKLYNKTDTGIKTKGTPGGQEFLRMWIEDSEGQVIIQYNDRAIFYVMTDDGREIRGVYSADGDRDDAIEYTFSANPVAGTPFKGRYTVLSLRHFSDAYVIFYED